MVEGGAREVSEQTLIDAILFGHEAVRQIVGAQVDAPAPRRLPEAVSGRRPRPTPPAVFAEVRRTWEAPMMAAMTLPNKIASYAEIKAVKKAAASHGPGDRAREAQAGRQGRRRPRQGPDARDDPRRQAPRRPRVRPDPSDHLARSASCPRTHGSALFTRGETQALVTATLGTSDDAQIIEEYEGESEHTFLLHYNFPPFSVGETKFMRGPSRRDIGHGNLARRSLSPMLPSEDAFPYTVRIVSDILESNGSSSMATVCGGTLALMDAGVPIKAPVAGVAMGLVSDGDRFAILTDIAGQEDHYGDMDFKVAGSRDGHHRAPDGHQDQGPAPRHPREGARAGPRRAPPHPREDGRGAREPRARTSPASRPRIFTIQIPKDRIRDVIGSGGKTIRSIIEATGCKIDVEDSGKVSIASADEAAAMKAIEIIEGLTQEPEIGKVYTGKVRRVEAYGAFVEILPGQDGLVHISELAPYRVRQTTDVVKEGDEVTVKIIAVDPMGKIKLSRKQALSKEELDAEMALAPVGAPGEDEGRDEFPRGGGARASTAATSTATTAGPGAEADSRGRAQ